MADFQLIFPEILLLLTLGGLVAAEMSYHGERFRLTFLISILGLGTALIRTLLSYGASPTELFGGAYVVDGISLYFKLFAITLATLTLLVTSVSKTIPESRKTEYFVFVIAGALGVSVLASALDLLLMFLGIQLVAIALTLLAGFAKERAASTEAAMKLFLFNGLSAGFFLLGLAILFASTGTVNLMAMHEALARAPLVRELGLTVFFLFFLCFSFLIQVFPAHFWSTDVREGAPTPSSFFLGLASTGAGFAIALRFFASTFSAPGQTGVSGQLLGTQDWTLVVSWASCLTLLIAGVLGLGQRSMKRVLAAFFLAQSGLLFSGFLVLGHHGVSAILYNLLSLLFASGGAYAAFAFLENQAGSDDAREVAKVVPQSIPEFVAFILFVSCMIGLPPFPGFIGRFALIGAVFQGGWIVPAVIAGFSQLLVMGVFARILYTLAQGVAENSRHKDVSFQWSRQGIFAAMLAPLLVLSVFAEFFLNWAARTIEVLF
jgi:NADH-quinone oxidoreductase subunit N